MKLKCPNLLKPLGTLIYQNSQFYYPSDPFCFHRFTMRHPVVQDSSNFFAKLAAKNNVAVNWLFGKRLNSIFYWQLKTIKENQQLVLFSRSMNTKHIQEAILNFKNSRIEQWEIFSNFVAFSEYMNIRRFLESPQYWPFYLCQNR